MTSSTSSLTFDPVALLAAELQLTNWKVAATLKLLQEGNTVPFIARYRKEATGNLDEVEIRNLQERLAYHTELEERRHTIITSIASQNKLTDALQQQILACTTKAALEDLYLPYKPKRRTRATIAKEKGLEPLALKILEQPLKGTPEQEATAFICAEKGVEDISDALSGAQDIIAELLAERADMRAIVRDALSTEGTIVSKALEDKKETTTKFDHYYDFKEKVAKIPSHRYLAIRRGEREGVLQFHIEIESESILHQLNSLAKLNPRSPFSPPLEKALQDSYKRLILPSIETDVRVDLKMSSDRSAVDVFADNLRNLLLAPPLGGKRVIGIDPGLRTGCKCAALDDTGKYLDTITIYLTQGSHSLKESCEELLAFVIKHRPFAIGIGNGTGGRETEAFVRKLLLEANITGMIVIPVSEAGASVYSASDVAREEFPTLDLTIRGAISIARRLQDPLAELVKVDPKAIGVGQYQHDVHQPLLQDKLTEVVESCVNHVGVELNTASAPLLSHVAGIGASLAVKIVKHRELHGAFKSRRQLLDVSGLGAKTFEQAAGFLRVRGGEHPLDSSAVHPERYALVEKIAKDEAIPLEQLIANSERIRKIDLKRYVDGSVGEFTLKDIIDELQKPGRDPRATFEKPTFRDDVVSVKDLKIGMKLEGIITNVTAFGVFVDVGVHQDGLIHISELTDRFIKDPSEVASVGNKILTEVLSIDVERNRIALTARIGQPPRQTSQEKGAAKAKTSHAPVKKTRDGFSHNPFAAL